MLCERLWHEGSVSYLIKFVFDVVTNFGKGSMTLQEMTGILNWTDV